MTDVVESFIDKTIAVDAAAEALVAALMALNEAADGLRSLAAPARTVSGPEFVFPAAPTKPQLHPQELRRLVAEAVLAKVGPLLATHAPGYLLLGNLYSTPDVSFAVAKALGRLAPAES